MEKHGEGDRYEHVRSLAKLSAERSTLLPGCDDLSLPRVLSAMPLALSAILSMMEDVVVGWENGDFGLVLGGKMLMLMSQCQREEDTKDKSGSLCRRSVGVLCRRSVVIACHPHQPHDGLLSRSVPTE